MVNIIDFGAVGDGIFMNTEAFAKAVKAAADDDNTVCVPAGTFLTGTINLAGMSLYLEKDAVIKASPDLNDYPYQNYYHNEMGRLRALIVNLSYDNVSITGQGTIDLSGKAFYDLEVYDVPKSRVPFTEEQVKECTHPIGKRPAQCIFFNDSKHITISGITIVDSPCWTVTISECEDVTLSHLHIDTDLNIPNDDGIHISASENIVISDCNISSGDDCIAVSSITNWDKPSKNIVVKNCVLRSCSKALVLGYIYSKVKHVSISDCKIYESNRGICMMTHNGHGCIEDVEIKNVTVDTRVRAGNWWGNGEPIFIMALPHDDILPDAQRKNGRDEISVRNVSLENIECKGENVIGIVGEDNMENVSLINVSFTRKESKNIELKGHVLDISPAKGNIEVGDAKWIYVQGAGNIKY